MVHSRVWLLVPSLQLAKEGVGQVVHQLHGDSASHRIGFPFTTGHRPPHSPASVPPARTCPAPHSSPDQHHPGPLRTPGGARPPLATEQAEWPLPPPGRLPPNRALFEPCCFPASCTSAIADDAPRLDSSPPAHRPGPTPASSTTVRSIVISSHFLSEEQAKNADPRGRARSMRSVRRLLQSNQCAGAHRQVRLSRGGTRSVDWPVPAATDTRCLLGSRYRRRHSW